MPDGKRYTVEEAAALAVANLKEAGLLTDDEAEELMSSYERHDT